MNGVGAMLTAAAAVVFFLWKFAEGAWSCCSSCAR